MKAEVEALMADRIDPAVIAGALDLLLDKRLKPVNLASLVQEAAAGPRTDREHAADRIARDLLRRRRDER